MNKIQAKGDEMIITIVDGTVKSSVSIGGSALDIVVKIMQGDKTIIIHMDKSDALVLAKALEETAKKR